MVRIIVPESDEVRDKIIVSTNTQTRIPRSSLRATDDVHRQIEQYLLTYNLFYDRRKNYYKNNGKKPNEIVSIQYLAQCLISVLLQKPDYARARPSTLLDNDHIYERLYYKTELPVFYFIAYVGKYIETKLKLRNDLSVAEKNDIQFYVIYEVCSIMTKKIIITRKDILSLSIDMLTDDLVETVINKIITIYRDNSGNGSFAKSLLFTSLVQSQISKDYGIAKPRKKK